MKILISVFCLTFLSAAIGAEVTADQISRYSEGEELLAKQAMDESCTKSDKLDKQLLELANKVNASLDQDIQTKTPLSSDSEIAFKELENFNHKELQKQKSECTAARNNYQRILIVREHAAIEAEKINREQKERARNSQTTNTQMQPTTTNCISNVAGQTVYTTCHSY
jgi:hypothetical protein